VRRKPFVGLRPVRFGFDAHPLQNLSAYSAKTYGEGSQHGLNVEFDFRRFAVVVQQLINDRGVAPTVQDEL
jgi:hypothetical protein